jgi:hypothetical protein
LKVCGGRSSDVFTIAETERIRIPHSSGLRG